MFCSFSHELRGCNGRPSIANSVASCTGGFVNAPCSAEAQNATSAMVQTIILSKRTIPPAPLVVINPQRQCANMALLTSGVKLFQSAVLILPMASVFT